MGERTMETVVVGVMCYSVPKSIKAEIMALVAAWPKDACPAGKLDHTTDEEMRRGESSALKAAKAGRKEAREELKGLKAKIATMPANDQKKFFS